MESSKMDSMHKKRKTYLYLACALTVLLASNIIVLLLDEEALWPLTKEDGLFETLTALFYLGAAILSFIAYFKGKRGNDLILFKTKRNIFLLLLAIIFFIGAGEEINWGQRLLNIDTPEALQKINLQKEINIHNLSLFHNEDAQGRPKSFWAMLLNFNRLLSLFIITYCFVVPLINRFSLTMAKFFRKINLPVVPIWLGIVFVVTIFISEFKEANASLRMVHRLVEIKESNFAFFFMVAGFIFLDQSRRPKTHQSD
jgi:hypothetical protein